MNTQDCLIGLDIGTSAVKGIVMSVEGSIIYRQKNTIDYESPQDGYQEFDADQLYQTITNVIRQLVAVLPETSSVVAISMASASGNTMLINDKGEPMIPAISWLDTRVDDEIETVFGDLDKSEVHQLIGWPLLPMFPLAHLAWLKCHSQDLLESAAHVCMSTDYINFKLTGSWGIDHSTATTFYLQDQERAQWYAPFLDKLHLPVDKLPPLYEPGTVLGKITPTAAIETGLDAGTSVVLGSFDHPSAARGAGVMDEGKLLLSCGTSWVGFSPQKDRRRAVEQNLLVDPYLQSNGLWGTMFSLPAIGPMVDKFIAGFITNQNDPYAVFSELAASEAAGAGGLIINPMNEYDLEQIEGYTDSTIARAVMEGTALLIKRNLDQLTESGFHFSSVVMVGGPSESYPWPQIVSDVLGKEIKTINGSSAGAVGAALLAGVGIGIYPTEQDAFQTANFSEITRKPNQVAHQLYQDHYIQFIKRYY